jgi:dihydroxyacid dehydratase/phosphogluconate dehydratase
MNEIRDLLHLDALTVSGTTVEENLEGAEIIDERVIAPRGRPFGEGGSLKVLYGSLCPDGAVIKVSAAQSSLLEHEGPAVVFEDIRDMAARVDDPELEVTSDSVLVLRNAGPVGAPGMPEWGHLPIPAKLLKEGVTDLVRISDARMSGTSYGAVVLHVAPEAAVGGPLALVQTGDRIRLSVADRTLDMLVEESELARRRDAWEPPARTDERGYRRMYVDHVLQANQGCDLDFLRGSSQVVTDTVTYL